MWKKVRDGFIQHRSALGAYRGSLRLLRPAVLDRDARERFESLKTANEAIELAPHAESKRIAAIVWQRTEAPRRLAASYARHKSREVRTFVAEAQAQIARTRRDVNESFPDATLGLRKGDLLTLALLEVEYTRLFTSASAAMLLERYTEAIKTTKADDPVAYVTVKMIEDRASSGTAIATSTPDLAIVKQLREIIDAVQDLRVPDLPDLDSLLTECDRLDARADLLKVNPAPDDNAAAAYTELESELGAAGELPDSEDQQVLRDTLVRAS